MTTTFSGLTKYGCFATKYSYCLFMDILPSKQDEIGHYKSLLLDMPLKRSLAGVLDLTVARLAALSQTALVRIWLLALSGSFSNRLSPDLAAETG